MSQNYDVIVIGARCAGAPTALLLARKGYRVLLVDKASFPSDTISTHMIHPPGVAALKRWGLLERLEATGCPPITSYSFDFGPITISGSPRPIDGIAEGFGPRRTVLDDLLVDPPSAPALSCARHSPSTRSLFEDGSVAGIRGHAKGGAPVTERARVVIGADGKHSILAKAVRPEHYNEVAQLQTGYYAYWSGLPVERLRDLHPRRTRARLRRDPHPRRPDVPGRWLAYAQFRPTATTTRATTCGCSSSPPPSPNGCAAPSARRGSRRSATCTGSSARPYGPGWALVGDAGYHKDPITAFGISDAFRDAEQAAAALDDAFSGRRPYAEAMAAWQQTRDAESLPVYGLTCEFAKIEPPPAPMLQLLGAVATNREAMDDFVSVMAGTLPAPAFFAPDNVARIIGNAQTAPA